MGVFGTEFKAGYSTLVALTLGRLLSGLAGSVSFLMTMTNYQAQAAKVFAMAVVLNIVLNSVMIPIWGIFGAGCATALTTVVWKVVMLAFVRRNIGVNPTVFRIPRRSNLG